MLHVDKNDFYGEDAGTHDLGSFISLLEKQKGEGKGFFVDFEVLGDVLTPESSFRKYALDTNFKPLLSSGPLVQLLVKSGVAKYMEFKCLQGAYLEKDGEILRVPASKQDVFQSEEISLIEKRLLMKFISVILNEDDTSNMDGERAFSEYLKEYKMEGKLRSVIINAICCKDNDVNDEMKTTEATKRIRQYVQSVGRFGKTAFLYPLYGCSEVIQAFSRLGAVSGATYMLRCSVTEYEEDNGRCVSVRDAEGNIYKCNDGVICSQNAPKVFVGELDKYQDGHRLYHGFVCVDKALLEGEDKDLLHITFALENGNVVRLVQLDSSLKVCDSGKFLIYLESRYPLKEFVEAKFGKSEFTLLFSSQPRLFSREKRVENIYVTSDPDFDLDYEGAINEARKLFESLCPGEEFLKEEKE